MYLPETIPEIIVTKFDSKTHTPTYTAIAISESEFNNLKLTKDQGVLEITKPKSWVINSNYFELHKEIIGNKVIRVVDRKLESNNWKKYETVTTLFYIMSESLYLKQKSKIN